MGTICRVRKLKYYIYQKEQTCYNTGIGKVNTLMKITEVTKPSKTAILESLKEDTDHTFSESTLEEIAESISNFDAAQEPLTLEQAFDVIDAM